MAGSKEKNTNLMNEEGTLFSLTISSPKTLGAGAARMGWGSEKRPNPILAPHLGPPHGKFLVWDLIKNIDKFA